MEPHWEWCHECGFDPDRKRPPADTPLLAPVPPAGYPFADHEDAAVQAPGSGPPLFSTSFDPLPAFEPAPNPLPTFEPAPEPPAPPTRAFDGVAKLSEGFGPVGAFSGHAGFAAPVGRDAPPATLAPSLPPPPPPPPPPPAPPAGFGVDPRLGLAAPADSRFEGMGGGWAGPRAGRPRPSIALPPVVRTALTALGGAVALVGGLALLLVALGGEPRSSPAATTLAPGAPPPIGQLDLSARPTTTAPAAAPDGWFTYRAPDGTFTANFPGQPVARGYQRIFGSVTQNGLEVYLQVGTDGPQYSAAYVDLPTASAFVDSQDFFDQALAEAYDLAGTVEVSPGLGATAFARKPGQGPATRGIVVLKGKRVYLLESLEAPDEDHNRFVTGFRWLSDPRS